MRRPAAVAAVAVIVLLAAGGAACSDGGDEAAFCERLRSVAGVEDLLDRFDARDPAGSAAAFAQAAEQLDELAGRAPSEIERSVEELAEVVEELADGLREVDRDDPAGALVVLDGVSGRAAELEQAGDELAAYAADRCGVTLGTAPATANTATVSTTPASPTTATLTTPGPTTAGPTSPAPTTVPPPPTTGG